MVCKFLNLKLRRVVSIFLMSVVMVMVFVPSVFAVPGTSDDVPGNVSDMGWIDLSASVPDGFSGSVVVQLRNTADSSYYGVECFVVNDFKNSKQIPLGNYEVAAVTTTEDPFIYAAICDVEEFELTGSFPLHVVVEEVPEANRLLTKNVENIEVGSESANKDESKDNGAADSSEDEEIGEVDGEGSDVGENETLKDLDGDVTEVEKETKSSSGSLLVSFAFSVALILAAGFVFWKMKNR